MSLFCKNCGHELRPGSKFCPNCGLPVDETSAESWETYPTYEAGHEETLKDKFFSYRGRLNRKPYFLRGILLSAVSSVLGLLEMLLFPEAFGPDAALRAAVESGGLTAGSGNLIFIALDVALSLSGISLTIRRSHDLNKSGWFLLLLFIPIVNLYAIFKLWLSKGTEGPNRFGPDPLAPAKGRV